MPRTKRVPFSPSPLRAERKAPLSCAPKMATRAQRHDAHELLVGELLEIQGVQRLAGVTLRQVDVRDGEDAARQGR